MRFSITNEDAKERVYVHECTPQELHTLIKQWVLITTNARTIRDDDSLIKKIEVIILAAGTSKRIPEDVLPLGRLVVRVEVWFYNYPGWIVRRDFLVSEV